MHPTTSPTSPTAPTPGTESASRHPDACAAARTSPASPAAVGHDAQPLNLRVRVQRIESDLHCGRPISDQDLLQHVQDCRFLMECAHDRFMASGKLPAESQDYAEARRWMHQRDHALQCLSPEWKAEREAQIQEAIAAGTGCFFLDAADRAREAVNEGSRGD